MKTTITTLAAVIALLLTGCGNAEETDATTEVADATTDSPQTEQAEAEEVEGTGDEEGMSDDEVIGVGDEFRVNTFDEDSTIYHWDVKITGVETVDVLKDADDNPEYYSGDDLDAPEKVDAKPANGNEFVHVTYEQTNSSGVPESLSLESQLVFSDGEVFAALGDDGDYYTPNLTEKHDLPAGQTQNNNTTSEGDWVFEIPKGSEFDALIVNETVIDAEEEFFVNLK